jgi:hypothetical protein
LHEYVKSAFVVEEAWAPENGPDLLTGAMGRPGGDAPDGVRKPARATLETPRRRPISTPKKGLPRVRSVRKETLLTC